MIRKTKTRNPNAPRSGARQQVSLGAVTATSSKPSRPGVVRVDPVARSRGKGYLQMDPEGGLRQVNVYNVNGKRVVRAFTPTKVDPAALKQLRSRQKSARRGLYEKAINR